MLPTTLGTTAMMLVGVVGPRLVWLALILICAGIWLMVLDSKWFHRLRRDPHSLESLREADEQAHFRAVEQEHSQMQNVGGYCLQCDQTYPEEVRVCPRCGWMI